MGTAQDMRLALTILRMLVGLLFVGHGTQKLFGWFGGHGPEGTAGFFESIGIRPGRRHAMLAGASEAGGGALLAAGLMTPLGAAAVIGVMTQAVKTVHLKNGPWVTDGGWEYNAVLAAICVLLVEEGPGPISLDRAFGTERSGPVWALAALGAGVAGPALLVRPDTTAAVGSDGAPAAGPAGAPSETVGATA